MREEAAHINRTEAGLRRQGNMSTSISKLTNLLFLTNLQKSDIENMVTSEIQKAAQNWWATQNNPASLKFGRRVHYPLHGMLL